jgi:hypothetical protein
VGQPAPALLAVPDPVLKGKISPLLYCLGIGLSFADRWIALAVYVGVAMMWLVPDRRVERHVSTAPGKLRE